jgi:drug/metabolite transporter (DMT)-like permease
VNFGLTVAYERILAGIVFTAGWFGLLSLLRLLPARPGAKPGSRRASLGWIIANGLAGPVVGIGCYQWALSTTPSGVVLPIAATTPLWSIPIAYWLEGDRPTSRSIAGGVIAVAGCIALALVSIR